MVIETTTFRLADGVDEAAFLDADERVRTGFLYRQPGFVRATTAKAADGQWIVVVIWNSLDDALAAEKGAAEATRDLVDEASVDRRRYATLD